LTVMPLETDARGGASRERVGAPPAHAEVVASAPFRGAALEWIDERGEQALTIICKATFALQPGVSRLEPEPDEVLFADELVPTRRSADVLVVGHAYTPRCAPAEATTVRVVVEPPAAALRSGPSVPAAWSSPPTLRTQQLDVADFLGTCAE